MSKRWVYDIETLRNFCCFCFYDLEKKEFKEFILFETIWQLDEMLQFLSNKPLLIGYNVLKFDGQVLQFIIESRRKWIGWGRGDILVDIYSFVQRLIVLTNSGEFAPYPEWKLQCRHIDIFTIFHFDNKAKSTSLKWLQFMIDWPDLREMPIHHDTAVIEDQIEDILFYCRNDVLSTNEVYNICKGQTDLTLYKGVNKMELRSDIKKEFGFYDSCYNWNDVKIGDQMNMVNYFRLTGLSKRTELYDLKHKLQKKESFTFGQCVPGYVQFQTKEFNDFYNSIRNQVVRLEKEDGKNKQEYKFTYRQTTYTIARGGIHSEDSIRIIVPGNSQILRDADVGSQYPNALRKRKLYPHHLGEPWTKIVEGNIQKRLDAKKKYKETKDPKYQSINEAYKLALNGGLFGKTGEKTSWQEDLFVHYSCTIGNQFEILMLIEMMELDSISVISANTDGIVCLFDKDQERLYNKNCKQWEKIVGNGELGQLEFQDYTKLIQLSINDYLAIKPDGTTKEKGDFLTDFELHKNKSFRVVPLALREFFLNNILPEEFLVNHIQENPKHIFDYCAAVRARGQWYFEERKVKSYQSSLFDASSGTICYGKEGTRLQKTVRYYISNEGNKLIKCNPDGRETEQQAGNWTITVFNIYKEIKDYKIDYKFYLEKIYSILKKLNGTRMTNYGNLQRA
jgi:hypothetical protein